jgi:GH24 family phage-related lysozyme (muramidase)
MALVNLRGLYVRVGEWPMYLDDCAAAVRQWEGLVPWMYLDTVGIVTVAHGRALASPNDADALPFMVGTRRATLAEVTAEFFRVHTMERGHLPAHYRMESSPVLLDEDMNALLVCAVKDRDQALQRYLRGYTTAPDAAKLALFDMAYNLGLAGLLRFHKLCAALATGDYAACEAECERMPGVAAFEARNAWTMSLFAGAAKAA